MIDGMHAIVYSDDPEATRAFFRDVLEWPSLDAGGGWLIFKSPPSELGVHPTAGQEGETGPATPHHQLSLMCADLEATVAELRAKGVTVDAETQEAGFGRVTSIEIPGAGSMMLYQPRHDLAHQLEG
ncbi:VOC family protein [Aquihabitans sp. McL0605]|uniref:VOC family protein n=1 Tax=Aquihabitans sp. McL0605 TaxID=3415671 RepID=UPI003CF464E9